MNGMRSAAVLLMVLSLPGVASARRRPAFAPQAANVLGTSRAGVPITFTRVFTQTPGELSLARTQEHYVNLVPNYLMIAEGALKNPELPIAYISITWADQVVRVTCFLDRARSDLLRRRFLVVLKATEGTIGTTAIGTVVGLSEGRAFRDGDVPVITADVTWMPGIFPEILPTSFNMAHQLIPGLWKTGGPGRVVARHTFTSIPPADGSPPLVYAVQEGIPIE